MIVLVAILVLFALREFRYGILTLIGSIIVFTPTILVGVIYNLFYPFVIAYQYRSARLFFKIWWRLIEGTISTIGNTLTNIATRYDELGNVWGEWIEDAVTTEEKTLFGDKNTTISASIGHLEYHKLRIFKRGVRLSKVLNIAFRQTRHAIGSYEEKIAIEEIEKKNYLGRK